MSRAATSAQLFIVFFTLMVFFFLTGAYLKAIRADFKAMQPCAEAKK